MRVGWGVEGYARRAVFGCCALARRSLLAPAGRACWVEEGKGGRQEEREAARQVVMVCPGEEGTLNPETLIPKP